MKSFIIMLFAITSLGACTYVPPSQNKADWYAVLENGGPEKLNPVSKIRGTICLELMSGMWVPLFGPDGFGGHREAYLYWVILNGKGPRFTDPQLIERDRLTQSHFIGTITIDRRGGKVTIDLQRIISKPGEPEKTEPSPANGSFPIKRWIE